MAKVDIDGEEYETDDMPEKARARLEDIMYCDRKIQELRREGATIQTARNAYSQSLKIMLKKTSETETSDS